MALSALMGISCLLLLLGWTTNDLRNLLIVDLLLTHSLPVRMVRVTANNRAKQLLVITSIVTTVYGYLSDALMFSMVGYYC